MVVDSDSTANFSGIHSARGHRHQRCLASI